MASALVDAVRDAVRILGTARGRETDGARRAGPLWQHGAACLSTWLHLTAPKSLRGVAIATRTNPCSAACASWGQLDVAAAVTT
jgi:hypothetical protein